MNSAPARWELKGLGLQRGGRWLFRGLDVSIPSGTFVAVTGPSGAGKTSFLNCLAGTLAPTEGRIVSDRSTAPGFVFQHFLLIHNASLLQNVLCGRLGRYPWWRTLVGFPRPDRDEALGLLDRVKLGHLAGRRAAEVSGGEQQRTALARALFQEPDVFLADEPVSNLDPSLAENVLEILRDETRRHGRSVICVLHNEALVERFADWRLVLGDHSETGWHLEGERAGS